MWNFGHQTPRWYWWEKQPNLSLKSAFINFYIHHAHPKLISVTKSVVETIEFWWQILVATIIWISRYSRILAFHIFRMFGMAILIFIVFWSEKSTKRKKLIFRSNHRYFCRLPTLSVQCTTAPIIFCVPGIPDLEDKVYF